MGKTSRRKGKSYENAKAKQLRDLEIDPTAKRHLEFQSQEADEGRDIDTALPFAIQCKSWKSTPSISSIDQISPTETHPLRMCALKRTMHKGVSGIEVAVVDWEVMLKILKLLVDNGLISEL